MLYDQSVALFLTMCQRVTQSYKGQKIGATTVSLPPPPFFMIDYDRKFHADSEKYKNIALKINGICSNSTSKF